MDSVISRMISCIAALRPPAVGIQAEQDPTDRTHEETDTEGGRAINSEVYSSPEGKNSLAIRLERKP